MLVVVILAANPQGIFTRGVNQSINKMFDSVEDMATVQCLGTLDDVNGGWSDNWSDPETGWTTCVACAQSRTRTCDNETPRCNGTQCQRVDLSLTSSSDLFETQSRVCNSEDYDVGAYGVCVRTTCGDDDGIRTRSVDCPSGCCRPPVPSATETCITAPYSDSWVEMYDWGACTGGSCGMGTQQQTVLCGGGGCCAPPPPSDTRSCAIGCCATDLQIGTDINGIPITGSFSDTPDGQTASAAGGCPPGYAGNPAALCTGTTFGAVSNQCGPESCPAVSVDAGYGRTWDISGATHDTTVTLNCSDGGWRYTGQASYYCWLGVWQNLNAGCVPNCPAQDVSVAPDLTMSLPETGDQGTVTRTCSSYDQGQACGEKRYEGGPLTWTCNAGTWTMSGSCGYKRCPDEIFCDGNGVCVTFPNSDHGTPQTVSCASGDPNYAGNFAATCDYGKWCGLNSNCTLASCSGTFSIGPGVSCPGTCTVGNWFSGGQYCDPSGSDGDAQCANCQAQGNAACVPVLAFCQPGYCVYTCQRDVPGSPLCGANGCETSLGENCYTCPMDCGSCCGNGSCEDGQGGRPSYGEDCAACVTDCGPCPPCSGGFYMSAMKSECCVGACCGTACAANGDAWCPGPDSHNTGSCGANGNPACSEIEYPCSEQACYNCVNCATCVPQTCADLGLCSGPNSYYNGCCGMMNCGSAAPTCADLGLCSGSTPTDNGCGGTINCGPCPSCTSPCGHGSIPNTGTDICYSASSVSCGNNCASVSFTAICMNGNWSPAAINSYTNSSCSVAACASCPSPCGHGSIASGSSDTCYSASTVACGSDCSSVSQTATCTNGSWSSASFTSYTNSACCVQQCCGMGDCGSTSDGCGGTIDCNGSLLYFQYVGFNRQHTTCDCTSCGGTVINDGGNLYCFFTKAPGLGYRDLSTIGVSSCGDVVDINQCGPGFWFEYQNFSSTRPHTCSRSGTCSDPPSCTTGSHGFGNIPRETCWVGCGGGSTCVAYYNSVGCM